MTNLFEILDARLSSIEKLLVEIRHQQLHGTKRNDIHLDGMALLPPEDDDDYYVNKRDVAYCDLKNGMTYDEFLQLRRGAKVIVSDVFKYLPSTNEGDELIITSINKDQFVTLYPKYNVRFKRVDGRNVSFINKVTFFENRIRFSHFSFHKF